MSKNATKVEVYDPRAERLLFDALKGRARGQTALVKVTKADAVALTGMPSEQAEPALKSLVKSYRSHLAVTDEGDLVYAFDPGFERRDRVPLAERLRKAGTVAWKAFQVFFKIWIMVTLVAYVVAFVAMMLALVLARSNDRDDRRGGGGDGLFWLWWWMMPDLAPQQRDPWGRQLQQRRNLPQKRFYQSVFDFVFGPKAAPVDPRAEDKRLVAFLRDHKGRITASELTALTGLSLEAAEEELTRLLAEYDGEVEVTDEGALVYVFTDLLKSASSTDSGWAWAWDRAEPEAPLTGNTPGANAVTGGFAGFNLLASMTIGPAFLQHMHVYDPVATFFVTAFPAAFSAVFFAVPGVRVLQRNHRRKKRLTRQIRRELLREIWAQQGELVDPQALAARVAGRVQQPEERVMGALDRLHKELDGDVTNDAEGRVRWRFPRLTEEKQAVARLRAASPERLGLGNIEFSSEDPGR